jgi:hypothetical protein
MPSWPMTIRARHHVQACGNEAVLPITLWLTLILNSYPNWTNMGKTFRLKILVVLV